MVGLSIPKWETREQAILFLKIEIKSVPSVKLHSQIRENPVLISVSDTMGFMHVSFAISMVGRSIYISQKAVRPPSA